MLDELVNVIGTVKKRILDHRSLIENYERRTRISLIDPILCALGWDVADPGLVTIEPRVAGNWADYALLMSNGRTIVLFVEAKKLSDIETPISQVIGYATAEPFQGGADVRYCVSTNGDSWQLIDTRERKYLFRVSIVQDDPNKCALQLLGLWRPAIADGSYTEPVEPVTSTPEPMDPVEPGSQDTEPKEEESDSSRPPSQDWTPLTVMDDPTGKAAPSAMRFPDGSEEDVSSWHSVLRKTASWLHAKGYLTQDKCPIATTPTAKAKSRYILSNGTQHGSGKQFLRAIPIVEGIFVEMHLSSAEAMRNTRRLLEALHQDPALLLLNLPSS